MSFVVRNRVLLQHNKRAGATHLIKYAMHKNYFSSFALFCDKTTTTTQSLQKSAGIETQQNTSLQKRMPKGPITLQDPDKKYTLKLIERENISYDTRRFRFALPSSKHVLGLPVGQHLYLSAMIDGKLVAHPYTPLSSDDDLGFVEFLIKLKTFAAPTPQQATVQNGVAAHPHFPNVVAKMSMSQHLDNLSIGDTLDFQGPNGLIVYEGNGNFAIRPEQKLSPVPHHFGAVGLIAGGTGITPMLQLIRTILKHSPEDSTKVSLLFANKSEKDILLRNELDKLAAAYPKQFHLWYTVDKSPGSHWKYSVGFINEELIAAHLPINNADAAVFMCGPPSMINFACTPSLDKLNFPTKKRFMF